MQKRSTFRLSVFVSLCLIIGSRLSAFPLNLASIVIQILKSNFTYVLIPIFFLNNLFCSYLKHSTKI
ncbi:hypothetical protein HMPREF0653_02194 [Prevotella disiens JCM 6334 = ATCC 29426]|uniref:Uncharacterized protein n=1 Tax=Prevotella disiens JCM 6334 = ATCC 29426 TaxID=1235811 RepID=A0ABN0NPX4_9BACT|nr:hypothetical protein HMPREF0653_02194 [Prevotella disiens JCM 6334 = ATCC 29426]